MSALEMPDSEGHSPRDHRGVERKSVSSNKQGGRDAGVNEVKVEADSMDIGQLLEMKLRQKALQSLLNKKKQNSVQ